MITPAVCKGPCGGLWAFHWKASGLYCGYCIRPQRIKEKAEFIKERKALAEKYQELQREKEWLFENTSKRVKVRR